MAALKRTPLFSAYTKHRPKLVDFSGWELPVQFSGINDEHRAVREKAGLFDVSHMGEIFVRGPGARDFLQRAACNDVDRIKTGQAQYSALLNEAGGIMDDIFIYQTGAREYLLCINAGNTDQDFEWLSSLPKPGCEITNESAAWAQLAIQGPAAAGIFERVLETDVNAFLRNHVASAKAAGVEMLAARTGYTGEDGFELFIPAAGATAVWEALMEAGADDGLIPCGLGARDTLRLEMGYPLHGHDITPAATPLEADLSWIVAIYKNDFVGKAALERRQAQGVSRKRVGMVMEEPGVPRHGYEIICPHGRGEVTSGNKTACLKKAVAMGYVPAADAREGAAVSIKIRDKQKKARIEKWPFYQARAARSKGPC